MNPIRRYEFQNIINFRDLGGYLTKDGSVTSFGKFFRCGIPIAPTTSDIEKIKSMNIKTIIDLRGSEEAERSPSAFKDVPWCKYYQLSLLNLNAATVKRDDIKLEDTYCLTIDNYKANIKKIITAIVNADNGGILFNCFFGKDRTGILASLLLYIAGVSLADIIADYQVSYTYIVKFIEEQKSINSSVIWETNESNLKSPPENIAHMFNHITETYDSIENYITSIGISEKDVLQIRKKFS